MSKFSEDRIHVALERCSGDRKKAAALLGVTKGELGKYIKDSIALREVWGDESPKPLSTTEAMHRPVQLGRENIEDGPVAPTDIQIAEVLAKEDELLKKGLAGLPLKTDELEVAMSLQKFYNRHFTQAIDVIGGGVTLTAIKLQSRMRQLEARLDSVEPDHQLGSVGLSPFTEEQMLLDAYINIAGELRKMLEIANKGAMTQAMIRQKMREGGKRGKPGFGAQTNIQIVTGPQPSKVLVNGNGGVSESENQNTSTHDNRTGG